MSKKRDFQSIQKEVETLTASASSSTSPSLAEKKPRQSHFLGNIVDELSEKEQRRIVRFSAETKDATVVSVQKKTVDMNEEKSIVAMFSAHKDQPSSWPKVLGFSIDSERIFKSYFDIEDAFPICTKIVNDKSFIHMGYSKFFKQDPTLTQSNNLQCAKNVFVDFPYPRPRNFATTLANVHQYASIVKEYLQREEEFNGEVFAQSFFSRSLLLDPFSIYKNQYGRVFHIPMVENCNMAENFVPQCILSIVSEREKFRAASLFCLIRLCYLNIFGRSLDNDFENELKSPNTYKKFCESLRAELFPVLDFQGKPASVLMVDWMMMCLKNTILTEELDRHTVFVADYVHSWINNTTIKEVPFKSKYATFTNLVSGSVRITDEVFTISVKTKPTELASDCLLLKKPCVEQLTDDVKRNVDFSLSVYAAVMKVLRVKRDYPRGMLFAFIYSDAKAVGIGVSREIVFRTFEGIKYWMGFEFNEETDTLDMLHGLTLLNEYNSMCEFIVVLLYWLMTNNETLPYILSPSLLSLMFNLAARNSLEHILDYTRVTNPSLANGVLNTDDKSSDFRSVHLVSNKLKLLENYATEKSASLSWIALTRFDVSNPVLRNFQNIVRAIYIDPNDLSFAFSLRTYDANQGRKLDITPTIAIALSNFVNFSLDEDIDVNDDFLNDTVPVLESTFNREELKLLHFLVHYSENDQASLHSYRVMRAAKRQTYCFFIRWLFEAEQEKLARLWKNLHGYTKMVPFRFDFESKRLLDTTIALLKNATTVPEERTHPYRDMVSLWRQRKAFCASMFNKHTSLPQSINIDFRTPHNEGRYQLAPQFMTCTKTVVLSICHDNYESFSMTMNRSCFDNKVGFTTDL